MRGWSPWIAILGAVAGIGALVTAWLRYNPDGLTTEQAISELVRFSVLVLALTAASGFAAMATLEMLKRLFQLRGRFFLRALLEQGGLRLLESSVLAREGLGGSAAALRLDLPLEQVIAQVSHAVDNALEVVTTRRSDDQRTVDRAVGLLHELLRERTRYSDVEGWLIRAFADDAVLLRAEAQAALDDLQVTVGNAWRWRLRSWSCVLAVAFTAVALLFVPGPPGAKVAALGGAAVLGGFFAGFFRDLVAVVERGRRT